MTINFYWVKTNIRRVLNSLLDKSTDEDVAESADQYVNFDGRTRCTSIYENYEHRGARLAHLCFYEYASQIFMQTLKGAKDRTFLFPFDPSHPLHTTHIQVSVSSLPIQNQYEESRKRKMVDRKRQAVNETNLKKTQ